MLSTAQNHATPDPNDAIEGLEGFLFLAGGAHHPLLYALGERPIAREALQNFWRNQIRRGQALKRRNIQHRHMIVPDKHNICAEVFPEKIVCRPGYHFLERSPDSETTKSILYPLSTLTENFRTNCYKVDSHFTPYGTGLLCITLLEALGEQVALTSFQKHLAQPERRKAGWSGDLGWRFSPPRTEERIHIMAEKSVKQHSNKLAGGNNGIMDLYINNSPNSLPLGRVMLFGDSYGRDMASLLSAVASEVMFLRTPHLHIDLVDSAKPDLVITQGAERYLPSSLCDSRREMFLLMPFLKDHSYSLSPCEAKAFSKFLSGRNSREKKD